jgi:hypothetical protein
MNIKTDQLKCYVEGINIPIKSIKTEAKRNILISAMIEIPVAEPIIPKMWANAFIQVTCVIEQNGTRMEKLLFQGLCSKMDVMELKGMIVIWATSLFNSLNMNTTLDYTAPKRYSVFNLQGDESKIFIGNESEVNITPPKSNDSYQLAMRYFFLPEESRDLSPELLNYSEKMTLEYIINALPFAERFAFCFFEDISYQNFLLSKSYIDRFNLLAKSGRSSDEEAKITESTSNYKIDLDFERTGLIHKMRFAVKNTATGSDVSVHISGLTEEFKSAVSSMSSRLGTKADWVLAVMNFETGGTFSTSIQNPSSHATGLIQFMPDTARTLGTSIEALAKMTQIEQLVYVEKYFNPYKGKMNSLEDVAMAVFYPAAMGNPDYKFPPNVVKQNPGIYTPRDYVKKVILNSK